MITEDETAAAIAWLWKHEHVRPEGSGAVTAGAILSGRAHGLRFPVVCVVSGGNIDAERFDAIVSAG